MFQIKPVVLNFLVKYLVSIFMAGLDIQVQKFLKWKAAQVVFGLIQETKYECPKLGWVHIYRYRGFRREKLLRLLCVWEKKITSKYK